MKKMLVFSFHFFIFVVFLSPLTGQLFEGMLGVGNKKQVDFTDGGSLNHGFMVNETHSSFL